MTHRRAIQRTIEIADFELPRGAVSIEQLMAMPRPVWDHLRSEITRRRQTDPAHPIARCRLCKGPIFIRAHFAGGEHAPVFAHYPESPTDCPWYQGVNLKPDDARAAQYQGHQESALHRWLCETIAEVLGKDPRCQLVTVETYRAPQSRPGDVFPMSMPSWTGSGNSRSKCNSPNPSRPRSSRATFIMKPRAWRCCGCSASWRRSCRRAFTM